MNTWLLLAMAILLEVIATTFLKQSDGFSRIGYTICALVLYAICFFLLAKIMQYLPMGLVYAMWSGLGIVLVSVIGFWLGQRLDLPAIIGIGFIIIGVVIIHMFSKTVKG